MSILELINFTLVQIYIYGELHRRYSESPNSVSSYTGYLAFRNDHFLMIQFAEGKGQSNDILP